MTDAKHPTASDFQRLIQGHHDDPFALLGPHFADDTQYVTAFDPGARGAHIALRDVVFPRRRAESAILGKSLSFVFMVRGAACAVGGAEGSVRRREGGTGSRELPRNETKERQLPHTRRMATRGTPRAPQARRRPAAAREVFGSRAGAATGRTTSQVHLCIRQAPVNVFQRRMLYLRLHSS